MDEHLTAAAELLAALGGPAAIIERRHLSSDDDVEAIARAVALDARVMRVATTTEATRVLAFQLRLRELAPPARYTLGQLVERALRRPVAWSGALLDHMADLRGKEGELEAAVALARGIDPHGNYSPVRARRAA